jgi:hypothetical protein
MLGWLAGCLRRPAALGVSSEQTVIAAPCPGTSCRDTVTVTFLGGGGFVIRHGAHAVMTPPLFTRPEFVQVIDTGGSNQDSVRQKLKKVDTSGIEAILAGHSHYDHLMDVPSLVHLLSSTPTIYGSVTAGHVLAARDAGIDKARVVSIDTMLAASSTREGEWFDVLDRAHQRRFRIQAVMSTHAPNFGNVTISNYTLSVDLPLLPVTPFDWPKGEVFAYIIEVLRDDGAVLFRIYYQDSASDPAHSVRPKMSDDRPFDLVIVCGGNFDKAKSYPATMLGAFPRAYALVGHWDDFSRDMNESPKLIPGLSGRELRRRMDDSVPGRWAALLPFATAVFAIPPTAE